MREQTILHNGMLWTGKLSCKSFFFSVLPRKLLNPNSAIGFGRISQRLRCSVIRADTQVRPYAPQGAPRQEPQCMPARSRCEIRPKPIAEFGLKIGLFCAAFVPFSGSAATITGIVPQVHSRFSGSTPSQNPPEANRGVWYEDTESKELSDPQNGKNRDIFPKSSSAPSFHVRYIGDSPSDMSAFILLSILCLGSIVLSYYRRRKKKE
jgi:hypothetical protein